MLSGDMISAFQRFSRPAAKAGAILGRYAGPDRRADDLGARQLPRDGGEIGAVHRAHLLHEGLGIPASPTTRTG